MNAVDPWFYLLLPLHLSPPGADLHEGSISGHHWLKKGCEPKEKGPSVTFPHIPRAGIYCLHVFLCPSCMVPIPLIQRTGGWVPAAAFIPGNKATIQSKRCSKHLLKVSLDGGGGLSFLFAGQDITWKSKNRISCRGGRGGGGNHCFCISCSLSKACACHSFN